MPRLVVLTRRPAPSSASSRSCQATASTALPGTDTHVIRPGESLWILARRKYGVPIWLLRQYNPDLDLDAIAVGVTVTVPQLEPLDEGSPVDKTTTARVG